MSVQFTSLRVHSISSPPLFDNEALAAPTPPQPPKCSKTLKTPIQQEIEFTYSPEDRSVSARLLLSKDRSVPIAPENLPKELRSLPSAEAFYSYLAHSATHVTRLGDGENRVYLHGRLLGGISYEEALANLTTHLNELANPFLLKDIVEKLDEFSLKEVSVRSPLIKSFDTMILPDDTRKYLTTLSEQIAEQISAHVSDIDSILRVKESIQKDLSCFSLLKDRKTNLTPALEIFFQLGATKKLDNGDICSIKQLILDSDLEQLRKTVSRLFALKKVNLGEVDVQLEQTDYVDLDTLLGEAIQETPKTKNGLDSYWDEAPPFFIGKTLYLTDPITFYTYNGRIKGAQKIGKTWVFELQDRSEIHIAENHTVKIAYKTTYEFWRALTKIFEAESSITIEPTSRDVQNPLIQAGRYILGNTEDNRKWVGQNYKRTFLFDPTGKRPLYSLDAFYKDGNSERPTKVAVNNLQNGKTTNSTVEELNTTLNLIGIDVKPIEGINTTNLGQKVLIKNEVDENELKLACLQVIEKERAQLRDDLRKEENRAVFDALLDDLVKQNFAKGNIALLTAQKPELAHRLKILVQNYLQDLQQVIDSAQLLKDLILEGNYANLVADVIEADLRDDRKKNVVSISHTMQLLNVAFQHIRRLSKRELIFFMGNTGSGKSTSVNYLLKTRLKSTKNAAGDSVVEVDPEQILAEEIPRIGQSIGNSETLYTQAYSLPDQSGMLADCPGFKDTRGQKHELCTNLSIDRAIQESGSIKAIVITVPIHSFLDEKGNTIVELIETVKERFPRTFNPDSMRDSSHVFLLITKSQQTLPETVKTLEDGTRIQALFNSSKERLTELLKRKQDGAKDIDSEIEKTRARSRIWQSLNIMQSSGQFDFIDPKNKKRIPFLLKKYTQAGEVDKRQYAPLMTGGTMRLKFGEYIELSTNTWTQHIFGEYLFSIPDSILKIEGELTAKKQELGQSEQEKRNQQERAVSIARNQKDLRDLIAQLEKAQAHPETLSGPLKEELQKAVEQVNKDGKGRVQREIRRIEENLETATQRKVELSNKIVLLQLKIGQTEQRIKQLEDEISQLEEGTTAVPLYENTYNPNQMLHLRTWKPGARTQCYDEFRPPQDADFTGDRQDVSAGDYRGTLAEIAFIQKEYKIVPTDPTLKAAFAERNRGGHFEATLVGRKFELDLARKASDTGLKVLYPFKLIFDGNPLPEIRITHTVPNTEYNSATVLTKNGEINLLKQQLIVDQADLKGAGQVRGKLREKEEAVHELGLLNRQKKEQEIQLELLEKAAQERKIEEMLQQKKVEDQNLTQEKAKAEDTSAIDTNIKTINEEISVLESKKKELEKRRRNFAIIIKFQEDTAKLLRDFAGLVVNDGAEEMLKRNETIEACQKYISLYDARIDEIRALCLTELQTA